MANNPPIEPIKVVANILQQQLALKDDQVLLYNQKFDIPADERMYVVLAFLGSKTFATKTEYVNDPLSGSLVETQTTNRQEIYSVRIRSWSSEARQRNWEISPALKSDFAQQQMEQASMSIGYLPTSMNDISRLEGTKILNEYALTIRALVAYSKTAPVDYFDQFAPPEIFTNP